jgi:hypothetical protein
MIHVQPRQFRICVVALGLETICFGGYRFLDPVLSLRLWVYTVIHLSEHTESYFGLLFTRTQ